MSFRARVILASVAHLSMVWAVGIVLFLGTPGSSWYQTIELFGRTLTWPILELPRLGVIAQALRWLGPLLFVLNSLLYGYVIIWTWDQVRSRIRGAS